MKRCSSEPESNAVKTGEMFPIMTLFHRKQTNKQTNSFMAFKIIHDFGPELTREKKKYIYIHIF